MSRQRSLLVHVPITQHDDTQDDVDLLAGAAMFFASAVRHEQERESAEDAAIWTADDATTYEVVLASFDSLLALVQEAHEMAGTALLRAGAPNELAAIRARLSTVIADLEGNP